MKNNIVWLQILFVSMLLAACQKTPPPEEPAAPDAEPAAETETPAAEEEAPPMRNFGRLGMPRGLLSKTDDATPGYVMFSPLKASETYLVNGDGEVVHIWESEFGPSGWVYLKENGNLLRGGRDHEAPVFAGGGQGGWFQELTWEGDVVWQYRYSSAESLTHHDVA